MEENIKYDSEFPLNIEELKEWTKEKVFLNIKIKIGRNSLDKNTLGIYKDRGGDYVIYRNKKKNKKEILFKNKSEEVAVEKFCKIINKFISYKENVELKRIKDLIFSKTSIIKKIKLFLYNV